MSSGTLFIRDSRTNKNYEIPINRNAVRATDLQGIRAPSLNSNRADQVAHGLRVYDPGLQNTAVTQSVISFSDHEHDLLLYRGYTLDQLWGCEFEEMFHLLLWGTYPTASQCEELRMHLVQYMQEVPDVVRQTIFNLPYDGSLGRVCQPGLSAYLACVPEVIPATTNATIYQTDIKRADQTILKTVTAYAVVFGAVRSHRLGLHWSSPSLHKTYYENLFTMAGLVDPETNRPDPTRISCFRRFGNLNAEHGMALTVFSSIVTASSLTDPVSCLISAVAAAHGPLHFGATESAQRALHDIGEPNNVPAFIEEIKGGKQKLFGYGHRTYKGMDPRVRPIQSILKDLTDVHQPLLKVAEAIEEAAAKDEYFSTRGLYPNADFYGNFVFTGIGFEPDIIPAAMLAHRIMGIMAHWREHMVTRGKLFRPIHLYTGSAEPTSDPRSKI
ncbi:Citrate synthase-like core [Penicillium expansum]|nr:Citrate synthase-like core [Penicillium expansum]